MGRSTNILRTPGRKLIPTTETNGNSTQVARKPMPPRERGNAPEIGAVVVTVIVAVIGFVPSGVTEGGEIEQLVVAGFPLHVRETAWLNPPAGTTLKV